MEERMSGVRGVFDYAGCFSEAVGSADGVARGAERPFLHCGDSMVTCSKL